MVGGQLLDAVPPAAAGVRPAAEGALRRGQANVHQPHRVVPLIPVRARHAGDGHGDVCPGDLPGALRHGPGCLLRHGAVLVQRFLGHAQHRRLDRGPVADHAAPVHAGDAGQGSDPLRHPAAGAALRSGQGEIPLLQQLEAHRFQALHIHAVHIVSQSRADLCHHRGQHGLCLLCAGGLGGGPQPHLAGLGISG